MKHDRRSIVSVLKVPVALLLGCGLGLGMAAPAWADPPPWAPAWGYHKHKERGHKHRERERERDHEYGHEREYDRGGAGVAYASPYIMDGRCNRETVGKVVGTMAGAAVGSNIGKGDGRTAATIVGAIVGYMVGGSVGRSMDDADRACVGQALEYGHDRQPVTWRNPDTGASYTVTPTSTYSTSSGYCRDFTREGVVDGRRQTLHGTACRQADGSWKIVR